MAMAKCSNYEVNADGNRSYASKSKDEVMDVWRTWQEQGHAPEAYAVGQDIDGRIVCDRIA